jgi:hypothetical protein
LLSTASSRRTLRLCDAEAPVLASRKTAVARASLRLTELVQAGWSPELDRRDGCGASATVAASVDHCAIYVLDEASASVVRFCVLTGATQVVALPGRPDRLAVHDASLFVSLPEASLVLELLDHAELHIHRKLWLDRPSGLVAVPDGLVVAQPDTVVRVDYASLEVLETVRVPGTRWLAWSDDRDCVYAVAPDQVHVLRLWRDDDVHLVATTLPLPAGFTGSGLGARPPRATGDAAVCPDGDVLAVPVLVAVPTDGLPRLQPAIAELRLAGHTTEPPRVVDHEGHLSAVRYAEDGRTLLLDVDGQTHRLAEPCGLDLTRRLQSS